MQGPLNSPLRLNQKGKRVVVVVQASGQERVSSWVQMSERALGMLPASIRGLVPVLERRSAGLESSVPPPVSSAHRSVGPVPSPEHESGPASELAGDVCEPAQKLQAGVVSW